MNNLADTRALVVLVHGFRDRPTCWDPFLKLLRDDFEISRHFKFVTLVYDTSWFDLNPRRNIPTIKQLGEQLKGFLNNAEFKDREITLVGHSMGGLVIHSYLAETVRGHADELARIKQVITLATPHAGSTQLSLIRRFLSRFFDAPQEQSLRVLDSDTASCVATVKDRIADTLKADTDHWPIPIHCFIGSSDKDVPAASARGPFQDSTVVQADHTSILMPRDEKDEIYRQFTQRLLNPPCPPNIFDIESYETQLIVKPVSPDVPMTVKHGRNTSEVRTDNYAKLKRKVRFAASNRRDAKFEVKYSTMGDGFVSYTAIPANEATSDDTVDYEKRGKKFVYQFTPGSKLSPSEFELTVEIYKGFDEGNRDVHFHLAKDKFFRKFSYALDLSALFRPASW